MRTLFSHFRREETSEALMFLEVELRYDPHVSWSVGRIVGGRSFIISLKGGELHNHPPFGALVYVSTCCSLYPPF